MTHTLTSPSNLLRRKLCPGSAAMEFGIAEATSPDASEGAMLHAATASNADAFPHLTEEQFNAVVRAKSLLSDAITASGLSGEVVTEYGMSFFGPHGVLFSGTSDVTLVSGINGFVADYKFGRGEVDAAPDNLQIAAYSVMLAQTHGLKGAVTAAIVRPRAPKEQQLTIASYDAEARLAAQNEIRAIYDASNRLDAPLSPSDEACKYCKAASFCHARNATVSVIPKTTTEELARLMSNDELGKMADAIKLASSKPVKDVVFGELKRRIEAEEIEGWTLKNTGSTTEITDVKQAFTVLSNEFSDAENFADDFLAACDVRVTGLVALLRQLTGESEAKAKKRLEAILGDIITKKPKAASPTREK